MNEIFLSGVCGFIGGVTRATVGMMKALAKKKKVNWAYWGITAGASGIIGIFSGMLFSTDLRLSLLAGYAGTDVLEGIYKTFRLQKVYTPSKTIIK